MKAGQAERLVGDMDLLHKIGNCHNLVFLGEAGSGKSEVAINVAAALHALGQREVHFFDMDMTKPLFRSRDREDELAALGIQVHYQEQFMDAPTLVGGVRPRLKNENVFTVLDVGGDYIGARSIGGFAAELNHKNTAVFYVLNAYRPWSNDLEHIDQTMGKILGISHIQPDRLRLINNSNNGPTTTAEEFIAGSQRIEEMIDPYAEIAFSTVKEELIRHVAGEMNTPLFPLKLYLSYPWH